MGGRVWEEEADLRAHPPPPSQRGRVRAEGGSGSLAAGPSPVLGECCQLQEPDSS